MILVWPLKKSKRFCTRETLKFWARKKKVLLKYKRKREVCGTQICRSNLSLTVDDLESFAVCAVPERRIAKAFSGNVPVKLDKILKAAVQNVVKPDEFLKICSVSQ